MPSRPRLHRWREVGRMPVELVQHVCDCGCKRRRMSVVARDGRGFAVAVPQFAQVAPEQADALRRAVGFGRELIALWERAKALAGG